MTGRPPSFTGAPENIAAPLCEWLAQGKTLREFCRQPNMPARETIDAWRRRDEVFASRVARARDLGFETLAEEALAIADTPKEGVTTTEDEDGKKTVREDMLGHRKLQVETRLKLLACWDPRRYGNKVAQQISGDPDGSPVQITVITGVPEPETSLEASEKTDP